MVITFSHAIVFRLTLPSFLLSVPSPSCTMTVCELRDPLLAGHDLLKFQILLSGFLQNAAKGDKRSVRLLNSFVDECSNFFLFRVGHGVTKLPEIDLKALLYLQQQLTKEIPLRRRADGSERESILVVQGGAFSSQRVDLVA